jgi:hypothetical protein
MAAVLASPMTWTPPPASRAQTLAAATRRTVRRQEIRNELMSAPVPMAPVLRVARALPGQPGQAASDGTTIYVQGSMDARTAAHESAHNLDHQVLTDADRARFSRVMGMAGKPWDVMEKQAGSASANTSAGSASERFADMVAMLATRKLPRPGRELGFTYLQDDPPNLRELRRFSRVLGRLQQRNGLADYVRPRRGV